MKHVTGTIAALIRIKNSRNGNPRFDLVLGLDNGGALVLRTKPDSSLGYTVQNYKIGDRVTVEHGIYYGKEALENIEEAHI